MMNLTIIKRFTPRQPGHFREWLIVMQDIRLSDNHVNSKGFKCQEYQTRQDWREAERKKIIRDCYACILPNKSK
jgi:hypothetical protein